MEIYIWIKLKYEIVGFIVKARWNTIVIFCWKISSKCIFPINPFPYFLVPTEIPCVIFSVVLDKVTGWYSAFFIWVRTYYRIICGSNSFVSIRIHRTCYKTDAVCSLSFVIVAKHISTGMVIRIIDSSPHSHLCTIMILGHDSKHHILLIFSQDASIKYMNLFLI